ncbi:pilin [Amycolatopsis sp. TRM77291]
MRLIDRFLPAVGGPRSAPLDNDPQPVAPGNRTPTRPRRWAHMALTVELAVLALLVSSSPAHADTVVLAIAGSVTDVLNNIRNWIMGILAGLATVFLSIGGVRYVMGSGDPGEIEKAKTAFKSAGWGYGLAALAPLVVEILKGIVGA